MLFTIPTAVELSMCIGVGGCGCPNSSNVNLKIFASFAFRNKALSSALAADAATCFNSTHDLNISIQFDVFFVHW